MIRRLEEKDRKNVLEYLYKESSYNIFIIGDIEHFGFDTDFQTIYGEFDVNNEYLSTLLFYREDAIFYSHTDIFNLEYLKIFNNHKFDYMSGKDTLMDLILPYLDNFHKKPMYFCKAQILENEVPYNKDRIKEIKTKEDCARLYDLLVQIDEFGIGKKGIDAFIEGKMASLEMGTTLYIEEDGKIVSTVATTTETTKSAMVIAVATDEKYRQKGYASMLMTALMKEYFTHRKKELCLFYSNPSAGKIYLRLGFKDIGKWGMTEKR